MSTADRFRMHQAKIVDAWAHGKHIGQIIVTDIGNGQWLRRGAADDFRAMQEDAASVGIVLRPNSGHRDHDKQARLRKRWERIRDKMKRQQGVNDWRDVEGLPPAPARPGTSVHERGEACDINRSHDDPDGYGPELGPTDKWLADNSVRYNFYRTIKRELWHFEWVLELA